MRTNIVVDDELMEQAMALSGSTTKKDVIHEALSFFVRFQRRKDLADLAGEVHLRPGYDPKKARETR